MADRVRVLVAEDDALVAEGLALQLRRLGHEVLPIAADGREALAAVRKLEPDVLLLDIQLPKLNGLEVCRRLMEERPIPIVIVTGYGDHHLIAEAEVCRAAGFLLKPSDERRLDAVIAQAQARFRVLQLPQTKAGPAAKTGARTRRSDSEADIQDDRRRPSQSVRGSLADAAVHASTSQHPRVRVLIVDDRLLLAEALAAVLEADPELEVVGTQVDLLQVSADVRRARPDVMVIDYVMLTRPGGAGLVSELEAVFHPLKTIILTQAEDEATLLSCVQSGAAGFVSKFRPPAELALAIKRAHAGEVLFASEQLVSLLTHSGRQQAMPEPQPTTTPLAPRELEVLQALATGRSTDEVASDLNITVHTVRTHLKNAMTKLQVHSKLELVMLALKENLIEFPK